MRQGNGEEVAVTISKNTLGSTGILYYTASSFLMQCTSLMPYNRDEQTLCKLCLLRIFSAEHESLKISGMLTGSYRAQNQAYLINA